MKFNRISHFIVLLLSALLFTNQTYAVNLDKIILFGDSLSDTGNLYHLTKKAKKAIPLIPIIPKDPPYYEGRFSNGPVWIEHIAKAMNLKLENYAYGGSWAESFLDSSLIVPFGLDMQVNFYLVSAATDFDRGQHLYVLWSGGNDYLQGRADIEYATTNTVASIQNQIEWLIYYGAKNIVVMNLPNLGGVPEVVAKGRDFADMLARTSDLHNAKLAAMVEKEVSKYPNVNFAFIDVNHYYQDIVQHPEQYGIKNVKDACYKGGYFFAKLASSPEIQAAKQANIEILGNASLRTVYLNSMGGPGSEMCANPDEYLFWDQVHPTRIMHQTLASQSFNYLYQKGFKGKA